MTIHDQIEAMKAAAIAMVPHLRREMVAMKSAFATAVQSSVRSDRDRRLASDVVDQLVLEDHLLDLGASEASVRAAVQELIWAQEEEEEKRQQPAADIERLRSEMRTAGVPERIIHIAIASVVRRRNERAGGQGR